MMSSSITSPSLLISGRRPHNVSTANLCAHFSASARIGLGNVLRQQAFKGTAVRPARLTCSAATARQSRSEDSDEPEQYRRQQSEFQERVVQVRRVTKVVKGGKQLSFRAVVVVGDEKGTVGVGCASAKEVVQAVQRAVTDAKRKLIKVPLTKSSSFPHRTDAYFGAAKVMLRPAAEGTGVIAGGSVRVVLELAGIKNAFGKELGSPNPLNNARATVEGLKNMKTYKQVAQDRNVSVDYLLGRIKPEVATA